MKRIISLILVLAMCTLAFASCGKCDHDYDDDGVCTKCGEKNDDKNDDKDGDKVSDETDWEALFDFSNFTVNMTQTDSEGNEASMTYRVCADMIYGCRDSEWFAAPGSYKSAITCMFDFADEFESFELKDGAYKADSITLDTESITVYNVVVTLKDGKLYTVSYDWGKEDDDETPPDSMVFIFSDFGKTVAPEDVVEGGNATEKPAPDDDPDINGDEGDGVVMPISENEWKLFYDLTNVTVYITQYDPDGDEFYTEYRFVSGDIYNRNSGDWVKVPAGDERMATYFFDFSDLYEIFYFDGAFLAERIVIDEDFLAAEMVLTNVAVTVVDGKLYYISYDWTMTYPNGVSECGEMTFGFTNYGTTVAPGFDDGYVDTSNAEPYSGFGIEFMYDKGFAYEDGVYSKGDTSFSVISHQMSDEEMDFFIYLDNDKYAEQFVPAYESMGVTVKDYDVFAFWDDRDDMYVRVIDVWFEHLGQEVYQRDFYVKTSDNSFTQINCTAINGASTDFITMIDFTLSLE